MFNNYGPKSNEELLMGYGFCLSDNEQVRRVCALHRCVSAEATLVARGFLSPTLASCDRTGSPSNFLRVPMRRFTPCGAIFWGSAALTTRSLCG